jgi:acyl-[acyl-carrier-protein]-phospholipid O-acyltransferase/long-chain-fatty-acid--[acyl-carrier-protein] ligase
MHQASTTTLDPAMLDGGEGNQRDRLMSVTFIGLLLTQFLGATNDSLLRWLVIGLGKQYVEHDQSTILAIGSGCLVLPYLLLAAPAGFLADRYSKRSVIIKCKLAEIVIMSLAVGVIVLRIPPAVAAKWPWMSNLNIYLMFGVVVLIGSQAALFGPSKLGSIPEMLRPNKISSANGLIGLTTVIATVLGAVIGNWLAVATGRFGQERWWLSAIVLIGMAVAGWIASLFIMPLKPANPFRVFPRDMVSQTVRDLKTLAHDRALLRVALGIMFFWTFAMLAQLNIDQFAIEGSAAAKQTQVSLLLGSLIVGVGLGSVLAGLWSGGKVELGILPLGAGGLTICAFLLWSIEGILVDPQGDYTVSYIAACFILLMLGISAGLFDVPLAAYMQDRSPPEHRGSILAASNFLTFGGMLVAAAVFWALRAPRVGIELTSREIFFLCGARRSHPRAEPYFLARRTAALRHLLAASAHAHRRRAHRHLARTWLRQADGRYPD